MTRPGAGRGRWLHPLAALALLAGMAAAMVTTAVQQSPTIDEPVYVGAAVSYQQEHRLRYNPEHPPLGKLLIGLGTLADPPRVTSDPTLDQEGLGRRLLYESGDDARALMLRARLPMIVLTLLFGVVVLLFATDLAGRGAGLLALALYAFAPDVVAHGSLATLDVPTAGFLLTACWLTWRARARPGRYLPLAGLALGAAIATRMSALPAVPVLLLLVVLSVVVAARGDGGDHHDGGGGVRGRRWLRGAAAALGVGLVAVAVVWASYLAVDPRLRWSAPAGLPVLDGLRGAVVEALPLPRAYRDGLRIQFGFERVRYGGFLFGRAYRGSLPYYLPAAVLVKTPLGLLASWAAGVVVLAGRRLRPAAPYLLAVPAVLSVAAVTGARDYGVRYVVFLPLFLAVAAGTVWTVRRPAARVVAVGLAGFVAVSSLRAFPYYLPYANEAFGGPATTRRHLHDSNVDWGQDLDRLAGRLRERYAGQPVWLVYKGSGVPSWYGIRAGDPLAVPPDRVRGLLVVSDSAAARPGRRLRVLLESSRPVDDVGHSITIYRR